MSRFLIIVIPVTARVWPAVAIGDELIARGHEVAWCGPEKDLRPLTGPDATIFPTGKRSYRAFREVGLAAVRELWDEYLLPLNRFIAGAVEGAVTSYRPDVILTDQYALAGVLAAHRHGITWAGLASGALEVIPPDDDTGLHELVSTRLERVRAAELQRTGVPLPDGFDLLMSPDLVIATTVATLNGPEPVPPQFLLVGAALGVRRTDPAFDWGWLDPGRAQLLVTAGTLSDHLVQDFLARVLAAVEPMGDRVQVVLNVPADAVSDPPPHVLVAPRVPMLQLMARVDGVLCQAGLSTVNEALAHGVPLVVAPIRLGELAVAEQVARAGAGIMVSFADATVAELAAAVTAILTEPGYRATTGRIAAEYAAAGGTAAAATALEALA